CKSIPDPILGVVDTATNPPRLVVHRASGVSGSREALRSPGSCCTSRGWCSICGHFCSIVGSPELAEGGTNWTTGDLNGDGYTDLVTIHGQSASVLFGRPFSKNDAASYTEPALDMSLGWGDPEGLQSLAVGDVNDDGYDDIVLGGAMPRVAVLLGRASWAAGQSVGPVDAIDVDTGLPAVADVLVTAPATWGQEPKTVGGIAGLAVADFNGDGRDDIAIGYIKEGNSTWTGTSPTCGNLNTCGNFLDQCNTTFSSEVFVVPADATWGAGSPVTIDLGSWSTEAIFHIQSTTLAIGSFMDVVDVDADFQGDLVVTGWGSGLTGATETTLHAFKGSTYPPGTSRTYDAADYEILRPAGGPGLEVTTLEGQRSLLVPDMSGRGLLYRIPATGGLSNPIDVSAPPAGTTVVRGRDVGQEFGYAHVVGDFDGDGQPDLAVGAPKAGSVEDPAWADRGVVYLFYGGNPALNANPGLARDSDAKIVGAAAGERFGEKLEVGDFNADGYDDLFVSREGQVDVFVIFGGPRGP
ncbi:MAG: hypothetical protein D6729_07110, partial [Deltaproteobacteria bacterium]